MEVTVIDRYERAPAQQVAHNALTVDMSNPEALTAAIRSCGVALDLDGTTLDSAGNLPDINKKALEEAITKGIKIVISPSTHLNDSMTLPLFTAAH